MAVLLDANGNWLYGASGHELYDADGEPAGGLIGTGVVSHVSRKRWKALRRELKAERKEVRKALAAEADEIEVVAPGGAGAPPGILGPLTRAAVASAVATASIPDTAGALEQAEAQLAHMQAYIAMQEQAALLEEEEEALIALLAA